MDFKFNKLYNTIMEDVKSSKIKAKKVIKESEEDWDDEDYDTPTITVGELRKEFGKCNPNEEISLSWNCYSDGGEDCDSFNYDDDLEVLYINQTTDHGDEEGNPTIKSPTVKEILDAIKNAPDTAKVKGYWDDNEGTCYAIESIKGSHLVLDGGTEC